MKIEVQIRPRKNENSELLGFATVQINDVVPGGDLLIQNVHVYRREDGYKVVLPIQMVAGAKRPILLLKGALRSEVDMAVARACDAMFGARDQMQVQ